MPHGFVEQTAKRAETLKSNFEADIRHAQVLRSQEFLCLLDAALDEISMGRLIECLTEQSQKVVTREAGFAGDLVEVERQVVTKIDKLPGTIESLNNIWGPHF